MCRELDIEHISEAFEEFEATPIASASVAQARQRTKDKTHT